MTASFEHFRGLHDQRVAALRGFGVTERQAEFLATVMIHSGVCLQRQYSASARLPFGRATHEWFQQLLRENWATAYPGAQRTSPIVHVHHKKLYRAIGEVDNRHRRLPTAARAIERLMLLDVVIQDRDVTWLGTEREKVAYCLEHRGLNPVDLPSVVFTSVGGRTIRCFPEKLPIGLSATGHVTFVYIATDPTGQAFRDFVERFRAVLVHLLPWRMLIALPRALSRTEQTYRSIANELMQPPLRPAVLDEFRWYCESRQRVDQSPRVIVRLDAARFQRARRAFGAPRFFAAYRRWKQDGDVSLHQLLSPTLHEAAARGDARVETWILPYSYAYLDATVQTA
jgi:hypothetical protein